MNICEHRDYVSMANREITRADIRRQVKKDIFNLVDEREAEHDKNRKELREKVKDKIKEKL